MRHITLLAMGVLLCSTAVFGQLDQSKLLAMRDSLDHLLVVSPSASAILIKRGQIELYSFNSFLSADQYTDKQGNNSGITGKQILFNSLFQVNYGISKNRRINIGLDLNYRAYVYDETGKATAGDLFKDSPTSARALNYIGPRVRIQPFRKKQNFIYQAYAWYPIAGEEAQIGLGSNKIDIGNTFFYYRYFGSKVGLFTQANFLLRLPKGSDESKAEFFIPLNVSVSYVAGRKNIFYGALSYSWLSSDVGKFAEGADSDMIQGTLGYQRIITKRFFVNLNFTHTLAARNYGLWDSVNLGFRYLY